MQALEHASISTVTSSSTSCCWAPIIATQLSKRIENDASLFIKKALETYNTFNYSYTLIPVVMHPRYRTRYHGWTSGLYHGRHLHAFWWHLHLHVMHLLCLLLLLLLLLLHSHLLVNVMPTGLLVSYVCTINHSRGRNITRLSCIIKSVRHLGVTGGIGVLNTLFFYRTWHLTMNRQLSLAI